MDEYDDSGRLSFSLVPLSTVTTAVFSTRHCLSILVWIRVGHFGLDDGHLVHSILGKYPILSFTFDTFSQTKMNQVEKQLRMTDKHIFVFVF